MSGQHTPGWLEVVMDTGKWDAEYDNQPDSCHVGIATDKGSIVALVVAYGPNLFENPDPTANARRLAACWNACEGLDTEGLENLLAIGGNIALMNDQATTGHLKAIGEANRLQLQRDELLEVLRRIESASMSMYTSKTSMVNDLQEMAFAAIAKAEGGAA